MICHGDELGRTQQGNNNGYCQDNELTWIDWESADADLMAFTRTVTALRREHPTFRRRRFFEGRPVRGQDGATLPDIAWLRPDGSVMTEEDWGAGFGRAVAVFLNGEGIQGTDDRGGRVLDDSFILCFSAHHEPIDFTPPAELQHASWQVVLDTAISGVEEETDPKPILPGASVTVQPRTLVVLRSLGE
jgi:glycogen operon protein